MVAVHQEVIERHRNQHQVANQRQRHAAADLHRGQQRGQTAVPQIAHVGAEKRFDGRLVEVHLDAQAGQRGGQVGLQQGQQGGQLRLHPGRFFEKDGHHQPQQRHHGQQKQNLHQQHQHKARHALAHTRLQPHHQRVQGIGHGRGHQKRCEHRSQPPQQPEQHSGDGQPSGVESVVGGGGHQAV